MATKKETATELKESRKVHILRRENESLFVTKNQKYIPEGFNKIGCSITAANRMIANDALLRIVMPSIIGVAATSPIWDKEIKNYFNSIAKQVPENGLILEVGFIYKDQTAYDTFHDLEKDIDKWYNEQDKSDGDKQLEVLKERFEKIIALEETHHIYGKPIVPEDYILWRHSLVYGDVANDQRFLPLSPKIRFYIEDVERKKFESDTQHKVKLDAMRKYIEVLAEPNKVKAILTLLDVDIRNMSDVDRQKVLDSKVTANPQKFLLLEKDKNLMVKAFIESCINANLLRRIPNTSRIVDKDSVAIGENMDDAVAFVLNERNKAIVSTLEAQLKAIG